MKRTISFILVMLIFISMFASAYAAGPSSKSPTFEGRFIPRITASYFRVCNAEGKLVKYISVNDVTCEGVESIDKYLSIRNLLYVFKFSTTYELKEGEYVEFPIQFRTERDLFAYVDKTNTELEIENIIEDNWILKITEYGIIIITVGDEK